MLDYIKGIADAVISVVNFIVNLFKDLVYMIELLVNVVGNIPSYFSWLPAELLLIIVALISVVVIYKILGREG